MANSAQRTETPNIRVRGPRVLVRENNDRTKQVGNLLVLTREPERILSGTVLAVGSHPLVEVGETVWFRRECGYEIPGYPGYLFLQNDMLEACGEANVVALAVGDAR
jgi:co-chaperonin GroES (HSP10)